VLCVTGEAYAVRLDQSIMGVTMLRKLLLVVLLALASVAQAAVYSSPWGPKPQFIDGNGAPMSGGSLLTFVGSSTTPQVTYTDSTGGVANPTTITLNVRGESPNEVWLTSGVLYKFVLKDSGGSTVWSVDNIAGVNDTTGSQSEWVTGPIPTFVSTTSFTLGGDQTTTFTVGRRVRTTNSGGTIYSRITSSVFGASTTVTVVNDSGVLDGGLSVVQYGLLQAVNVSIPFSGGAFALTDGATVAWSVNTGNVATWTMAGSRTLSNPTNVQVGGRYILQVTQDGTGGRVITWGSKYLGVNGAFQPPQPNPTASSVTEYYFFSPDGSNLYLVAPNVVPFGNVYLSKSGANLQLCRKDGTLLTINGKVEVVPDTCPTLAIGAAAANTTYFIYAFMNAGVMTLEFSTTTHATQAGTGVEIKSADATRTLVGMARSNASPAWEDDNSLMGVSSYFNRRTKAIVNHYTANRATTSATFIDLNSEIRGNFLTWGDEAVQVAFTGGMANSAASVVQISVAFNGIANEDLVSEFNGAITVATTPIAGSIYKSGLTEGFNFATIIGAISGGFTLTVLGGASGAATSLTVLVRG
jgi:hypothetical protein